MAECYNKIYLKNKDIEVECGKCLNCIENKKKEKALRLVHEMNNYKFKYFITLTMDELQATRNKEGLTEVRKKDLTKYIKHLQYWAKRYSITDEAGKIAYLSCGEYGAVTDRAHYHLVILCNTFLLRQIKTAWKRGHVEVQAVKDVRALYYVAGYTDKKAQTYFRDKYKDKENREIAFLKASRGNGSKWIKEAIAMKKITPNSYFVDSFNGKNKLPQYYKIKIKEAVMGITPRYKKLLPEERLYRKIHFGDNSKTYMINRDSYDENYWKWELYVNKIKKAAKERDPLYYKTEEMSQYKNNWKQRVFNLLYNNKYEEMDEIEKMFSEHLKRRREKLKINAEQKYFAKYNNRKAV